MFINVAFGKCGNPSLFVSFLIHDACYVFQESKYIFFCFVMNRKKELDGLTEKQQLEKVKSILEELGMQGTQQEEAPCKRVLY